MIRLLIDGQEVALPDDFSFTLYEENPVYTKNGQYTYDLTLSLKNFRNARIYEHIDRVNIKKDIQYNRSAVLWVDNKIRLNGTEVILGFGDSDVKIFLVSGKSELNFLIESDTKIRSLDLGTAERYSADSWSEVYFKIWDDLQLSYPNRDWQLLPYYTNEQDIQSGNNPFCLFVGNTYSFYNSPNAPWNDRYIAMYNPRYSRQVPQPYLCFIIKKILESLGYNLVYNSLAEHPVLKNLYIVHGFQILEFSKMLPDWTVKDFLSKIEQQFDCTFIIDTNTRNIHLLFNFEAAEDVFGRQTLIIKDEYNVEKDSNNRRNVRISNIGYNLDSDTYYKYMDLGYDIRKDSESEDVDMTISDFINYINTNPSSVKKNTLYKIENNSFIIYDTGSELTIKKVDSFKSYLNDESKSELDIEFDIIPAAMTYGYIKTLSSVGNPGPEVDYWAQVPIAADFDPLFPYGVEPDPVQDPDIDIQSIIEGDSSNTTGNIPTKIRLAIYDGVHKVDATDTSAGKDVYYPIAYVESLTEYVQEIKNERYFANKDINPFRLNYLIDEIYSKFESIDTTMPYKFSFELKDDFDIRAVFIIRNREFICSKIEKGVTIDGFSKFALGYFYPKG